MNIEKRIKQEEAGDVQKLPHYPWIGKRPFYGWIIVGVGVITQFFQGIANQGFGTYLPYLEERFGWSRAAMALPRSVTQVQNAILGPIEGWLVDKFGPRKVVTVGIFIMGGGLILFGLTNSMWLYYVANITIAIGTGMQGLLVLSVAVNHWFRRRRSLSQSLFLLGFALAGAVGVPLLVLVETNIGWEVSAVGSGLIIWVFGFPAAQLLRTSPEPYGLQPDGYVAGADSEADVERRAFDDDEYDFTLREALLTRSFWLLAVGWAVGNLGMGAIQVHLYLYLQNEVGIQAIVASLIWSVASWSNIPFRLLGGFFGDKVPKNILVGVSMILIAASTYVLSIADSVPVAMAYAVLYGMGWGVRTPVMNALQGDYFGRKSQGVIRGWLQSLSMPLTIAAPPLLGLYYDTHGTYRPALAFLAYVMLAGAVLIFLATRPRPPRHTESH